jgi:hypothetical protein
MVFTACKENINEPTVEDQVFEVDENTPTGTIIGVIEAYDLDPGQALSFSILPEDLDGTFSLDPRGGQIMVENPTLLDYEITVVKYFHVVVGDDGKPPKESEALITVNIRDVNEYAPVIEDQSFDIEEDPEAGALVGIIEVSDPEPHQGLLLTILSGNENSAFSLDGTTGALTVNNPAVFDSQVNPQLVLTVQVRDIVIDSKTDTGIITVHILPE